MDKRYRDHQGKARKWIDTRYSKPFRVRRSLAIMMVGAISAQTISAVQIIQSEKATTKAQKASKAFAIADLIVTAEINKSKLMMNAMAARAPALSAKA